jgi:hypothetical protein
VLISLILISTLKTLLAKEKQVNDKKKQKKQTQKLRAA